MGLADLLILAALAVLVVLMLRGRKRSRAKGCGCGCAMPAKGWAPYPPPAAAEMFCWTGWPPPPAQPPGQAMISTKSYSTSPAFTASIRARVFPSPLATATRTVPAPGTSKLASFQPFMPRTAVKASAGGLFPVTR